MQNLMDELTINLSIPFSFKDALSYKTKEELHELRRNYGIQNASSLNKGPLIDLLVEEIPKRLENVFLTWDEHRMNIMKELVFRNGKIPAERLEIQQLYYFQATGFIFLVMEEGSNKLALPSDPGLIKALKVGLSDTKWTSIIKQNTEWIKLLHGLLYYYGTLRADQFFEMLEEGLIEMKDFRRFLSAIRQAESYYESHYHDEHGFSHYEVMAPKMILEQQAMRPSLDFYPFTKKELIRAGEENYVERTASFKKVSSLLRKECSLSQKEAELHTKECQSMFKQGYIPNEVVKILSEDVVFETMDSAKTVINLVDAFL